MGTFSNNLGDFPANNQDSQSGTDPCNILWGSSSTAHIPLRARLVPCFLSVVLKS